MRVEGEEEDWFLGGVGFLAQEGDIAIGMLTVDDFGAWRAGDPQSFHACGDPPVQPDFDRRADTPNVRPPRAAWDGTQNVAVVLLGQVPSLLGFHLEFAVNFVLVSMAAQILDMLVALIDVGDCFTGEVSG